jgi:hypothetical protein
LCLSEGNVDRVLEWYQMLSVIKISHFVVTKLAEDAKYNTT